VIQEFAPAKLNLYLHVGGVRSDGLHDLKSLFVFAEDGDIVKAASADTLSLTIVGPFASALERFPPEANLIWKAARLLQDYSKTDYGAAITLDKRLPIAAGIGGGSADAAAALRALKRLWRIDISNEALSKLAFRLGADVPACLSGAPVLVSGAGEVLKKGPVLPPLWACLVNPLVETPTGRIFRAFDAANPYPPVPSSPTLSGPTYASVQDMMATSRNDLQPAGLAHAPVIETVIAKLQDAPGALCARMSGSGATCFALFASKSAAEAATKRARGDGWWAMASSIILR